MQWTTGDFSGGSGGFGGTPSTVGVNNGNGTDYVQVGRFDQSGTAYDGPGGNNDGVDYLDNQCIGFNVSTAGNIPPSASNLPPNNTVTVACGQTVTINPQFLAPEVNQTVTVGVNTERALQYHCKHHERGYGQRHHRHYGECLQRGYPPHCGDSYRQWQPNRRNYRDHQCGGDALRFSV